MGRPIKNTWFGTPVTSGSGHIKVNGVLFSDNTYFTNAYIVKQTGSAAYVVQDTGMTHAPEIVFMVNATAQAALMPGQCFILATPFGGSALPCEKIQQFRLSVYTSPNSTTPNVVGAPAVQPVANYSWSTIPAVAVGEANLIT
jgi:hypothetical protein